MKLLRFWPVYLIGIFLVVSQIGWTKIDAEGDSKFFLVLESPSVLSYQHQLSGQASRQSPRFQAMRPQALRYSAVLDAEHQALTARIQQAVPQARVVREFKELVNALTVQVDPAYEEALRGLPGVAYVAPVVKVYPLLTKSNALMDVPDAWALLGGGANAGDGVFIAVIDTGVDATHPAFQDDGYTYPPGFPKGETGWTSKKVIAARTFPPSSGEKGDITPLDRVGHGTDVASIAAANFNTPSPLGPLSGVAPKAYLGNYKVFTNDEADSDQIIAAIEQAVLDGVDVINLSLGTDQYGDPQHDLQVKAVRNAIDLGVVVVVAAGNSGKENTIGNPAQVEEAITVGAVTNAHISRTGTPADEDLLISAYTADATVSQNVPAVFGSEGGPFREPIVGLFRLVDADNLDGGTYGGATDGVLCSPISTTLPIDTWVLVQREQCTFVNKVNNAQAMGAQGVIFYNHITTTTNVVPQVPGTVIPSMIVKREEGLKLKEALKDNAELWVEIKSGHMTDSPNPPNRLTVYSGLGPTVHYLAKPDVVTIGAGSFGATQNDLSTEPQFKAGGFGWYSGTSMAAPRVAGLAALLRQKFPDWPPAWIRSAVMLGAETPVFFAQTPSQEATVIHRGTGRVNAENSLRVDTLVLPAIVGFGKHTVFEETHLRQWITIVNPSETESFEYVLSTTHNLDPKIDLSTSSFTLKPQERKDISVDLTLSANIFSGDFDLALTLQNNSTGKSYTIPGWVRVIKVNPPTGTILLIDDDDATLYEALYKRLLEQAGYTYYYWDVNAIGEYPTTRFMKEFQSVIWYLAQLSLNSIFEPDSPVFIETYNNRQLFEDDLAEYLVGGGRLLLSGMDYLDQRDESAFAQDVLGIKMVNHDMGATNVSGNPNNPVGKDSDPLRTDDSLGPFTLTYPEGYDDLADRILPLFPTVQPAFYANNRESLTVGVTVDACSYRAVFLAFPLEVMQDNDALAIMRNSLQWLQGITSAPPTMVNFSPNLIDVSAQTSRIPVTIMGTNFSLHFGYRAYLNDIPVLNLNRQDCNTLTGEIPAGIQPADYTLRLVTGEGQVLRLENALRVTQNTRVPEWSLF